MLRPLLLSLALVGACGPKGADDATGDDTTAGDATGHAPAECPADLPQVATLQDYAQRSAEALCAKAEACGCPDVAPDCVAGEAASLRSFLGEQQANGLEFDAGCAAISVAEIGWGSCGFEVDSPCESCAALRGLQGQGAACRDFGGYSDCVDGLWCVKGTCGALPLDLAAGAPCVDPETFDLLGLCADGLVCDDVAGVCAAEPAIGAACVGFSCGEGAFCATDAGGQGVCAALHADGEPCDADSQCASHGCVAGRCVPYSLVCRLVPRQG